MSEVWQLRTVGESVRITKGVTYASSDYAAEGDGHVFLTIKCFAKGGGFNTDGVKYFRGAYLPEQEIAPGELLIAKTDLTRDGDIIGSPMIAPDFGEGRKVLPSMDLSVLRAMDGDTDLRFLFYRLMLGDARRFMWAHSAGSTVLHLESKALPKFAFNAPKYAGQCRIAEILSTLDEAIAQTETLIAKHQQIKAGLMHDLFTRGVTPDGHLRPTREQAPDLYKESPLGWIPKEWEMKSCSEICSAVIDCKNRTPPITVDGHPVIRTPNVRDGEFVWSDLNHTDSDSYVVWTARGKPQTGDIVITREAPVGEVCMIPESLQAPCLGQRMMLYRPNPEQVHVAYMLHALQSPRVRKHLEVISGGSTVGHVKVGEIRSLQLPCPHMDEQKIIAKALDAVRSKLVCVNEQRAKLHQQKLGLMRDLLTGRVRVSLTKKRDTRG